MRIILALGVFRAVFACLIASLGRIVLATVKLVLSIVLRDAIRETVYYAQTISVKSAQL